jgi:hypothetical protein
MSTGPHPTVNGSPALALAPKPEDTPEGGTVLGDLKEVKEGVVSLGRLWGRLSGGSKAVVGGVLVTLLGPLGLTAYNQGLAVWGAPDEIKALSGRVGVLEGKAGRVESMVEALTVAAGLPVPPPSTAPTSQP